MSDEPEFSWTAIADQCRRFVCAHDDPDVDDTILGSILRDLRVVAGLPAVFPGDPTGIDRAARIAELKRFIRYVDDAGLTVAYRELRGRLSELEETT